MFRRILFILVLLGLGFIVWRMINPTGATNALENLKDLPGKIFSRDKDVVIEEQDNIEVNADTVLVIDEEDVYKPLSPEGDLPLSGETTNVGAEDVPDALFDEDAALEDALLALIEEDKENIDNIENNIEEDIEVVEEIVDKVVEEDVYKPLSSDEDLPLTRENDEDDEIAVDCREEGEIALMNSEETKCCEKLNWIYYRGDDKNAGAICFDAEEGIPQCKNQDTSDEGRYYMDGTLLRKDLNCGDYFGIKYYEVEVVDDSSSLKSILQNIFK